MLPEAYIQDPCGASSLPFWKTKCFPLPPSITVLRGDLFLRLEDGCVDTPYFKLIHRLDALSPLPLPPGFSFDPVDEQSMADHISRCYKEEGVSVEELKQYQERRVYSPDLWIALKEDDSGTIAASGIAELDREIREGVLEWIQVSPAFRRQGLGRFLVNELLLRLKGQADFVTVSGRAENASDPLALYLRCGFENPVIWHVLRKKPSLD